MEQVLNDIKKEVNEYLETLFPEKETAYPFILGESMRYALLGGGKRVRATLCVLIGRIFQGKDEDLFPIAAALEMIHAYSLVHDDLPAMDDDEYRRGRLCTHKKFGEALGILTGDALLTHAFYLISQMKNTTAIPAILKTLSWEAGIGGMVSGQTADVLMAKKHSVEEVFACTKEDKEILEYIHQNKTAALIHCSCYCGALAGNCSKEELEQISIYGNRIGMIFQIVDDILDVVSTQEKMGKKVGKDQDLGKFTFPGIWGMEKAQKYADQLIEEACQAVKNIPQGQI
ncbi:MAG TPA: polyprenyl synthetase family protein, partial [Planctomycetota bacterium]|nr:polyprenyl synthetase family protein [Planctomycetota bacterium]